MQKDDFDIRVFPNLERFCNADMQKPLRVCIATEEILGPVRNGGIASTYYHLAVGLSAQGKRGYSSAAQGQTCSARNT